MSASHSDPAAIERDLDATRARLGGRLDELQNRLSPGQVLDDLMAQLRSTEGGQFGRNLLASMRENPLPAALTGIGLIWLMASSSGRAVAVPNGSYEPSAATDMAARLRAAELGVERGADEHDHAYSERVDAARGQVLGLVRSAQETAADYGKRIAAALGSARQSVREGLHDAGDRIGSAGSGLKGAMPSVGTLGENPVLLGALGVAAGAILGSLLPISEQEEAYLGPVADRVHDTAADLTRQAKEVAHTTLQAGDDAIRAPAH
jgi:hypothetical protein